MVEVDRTASNSNELEHPKKTAKQPQKPYELRGMVELNRTVTPNLREP